MKRETTTNYQESNKYYINKQRAKRSENTEKIEPTAKKYNERREDEKFDKTLYNSFQKRGKLNK